MCFFIDGLDEYDGDSNLIAQYFKEMSTHSVHAKFCISSRPWPDFQDIYKDSPGLKLQDLTEDDIKSFINSQLATNRHMVQLVSCNPNDATGLINEIVQKAAGVFLWVELVVRSLLKGLFNGDDIYHLRKRVDLLPANLESLYEHMLNSIDAEYKEEASQIFQVFRASSHSLDIPTLHRALWSHNFRQVMEMSTKMRDIDKEGLENLHSV